MKKVAYKELHCTLCYNFTGKAVQKNGAVYGVFCKKYGFVSVGKITKCDYGKVPEKDGELDSFFGVKIVP